MVVKRYLLDLLLLLVYLGFISLLLHSFFMYHGVYRSLGRMIAHPSIERIYGNADREE